MRKTAPLFILLCCSLSFCTKKEGTAAKPASVDSTIVLPSTTFTPHIDTFAGLFTARVGDGGFTSDSMKFTTFYVNHATDSSVIITGNMVGLEYLYTSGAALYRADPLNITIVPDSLGNYTGNPRNHYYENISVRTDSLLMTITSSPGSCLIILQQQFAGRKLP